MTMDKVYIKILIIDDDRGYRITAARFFSTIGGHLVEVAENGREGLKKAAQLHPDIILLDMHMPDMTGLEVIEALSADAAMRDIPVILITGSSLDATERDSLKINYNFMRLEQKPVNFEKLLGIIETALQPGVTRPDKRKAVSGDSTEPT